MLGTDAHDPPIVLHLAKQALVKQLATSSRPPYQTSQHSDGRGFASPIVTQKREDLIVEHLQIDSLHGLEAI